MSKQVATWSLNEFAYKFIRPFAPDWFANRYRKQAARSFAVPYQVVSKVGVHSVGSNRTGYGAFIQTIKDAGRRLSVVVCYDDFGAAYDAKQAWPDVMTVGMLTNTDFGFDYNAFKIKTQQNPWIDYWCIYNEIGGQDPTVYARQANDYIALMPQMKADGIRLGMFSCASGTPPTASESNGLACYAEIARACKYAIDNHYDAILCLHEYQSSGGTIGRYQSMRDYLAQHGALLPIVISEYGFETFSNTDTLMSMLRANDPLYMADSAVVGCANWTVGGGGWGGSNWSVAFPQVGEYIATVAPIAPPATEYIFDHWVDVATGANLGTANPLTFVIESDRNIKAVFVPKVPPVIMYTCLTSVEPSGAGTVTGGGTFAAGSTVTLTASEV